MRITGRLAGLPAPALEQKIAKAISTHICATAPRGLLRDCDAMTIGGVIKRAGQDDFNALSLVASVTIASGTLSIRLELATFANLFEVPPNTIDAKLLTFETTLRFAVVALKRNC